jgi:ActR/RegA family two-component response regulator
MEDPEHLHPARPDQTVILVVDDEVMVRNIVQITLEADGYFILAAHDCEEALHLSRKFPGTIHGVCERREDADNGRGGIARANSGLD